MYGSTQSFVVIESPAGPRTVTAEVVATQPAIARGLMYREHLAWNAGMLFLMPYEHDWALYMRNTIIPLDMIYIAANMTVAGVVENAPPLSEVHRRVGVPSLYVLEVNGGWTRANQVTAGAAVRMHVVPSCIQ